MSNDETREEDLMVPELEDVEEDHEAEPDDAEVTHEALVDPAIEEEVKS